MTTTWAVGIDGCRSGWVAIGRTEGRWEWSTAAVEAIGDLIRDDAVTGIDIPVGLLESGVRTCDLLARQALPGAASRVFVTPPRAVLELGWHAPNDAAQALARSLTGKGVSRQALALGPRILAVDRLLESRPHPHVIEVHPELSFAAMGEGRPLPSKKAADGVAARLAALRDQFDDLDALLADSPGAVPIDDRLDALAALWSAERWRDGQATTLPPDARVRPFIAT